MSNPFSDVPPPLPPKQAAAPRRQQQQPHQSTRPNPRTDPSHTHHLPRSTDPPPRSRPSRSQTTALPPSSNTTSRPQPTPARRSHSSDSVPSDKAKPHRSKTKKGSTHADVIDRLDFTGVGPMFHHDGPFDACAPSRNKHRTKAPMYAWTSINAEDEEVAARYRDPEDGPVAPALTYDASYTSEVPRSPVNANYASYYSEPPKKKVDAIAEAWGIHEPEPYEEFFAGGGDDFDGPINNGNSTIRETRSNGRRTRDDLTSRPRVPNRSNIPPPQPIFVPAVVDPEAYSPQPSPPGSGGGANIGRNHSIMRRIRRMRDSPNVPVSIDEMTGAPSDGRFARRGDGSPTTPIDPYAYVGNGAKELPATPASPSGDGYFDRGLGRKTSLLKKVRGVVVRGGK